MKTPRQTYQNREAKYSSIVVRQKKTERLLSNLRLLVFMAGLGIAIPLFAFRNYILLAPLVLIALVFVILVVVHGRLVLRLKFTTLMQEINTRSLARLDGEWKSFSDDGCDFKDDGHSYSSDLDVFGPGSLFQWINCANTYIGRNKLRNLLAEPPGAKADILARQQAVKELAEKLPWRQEFLAEGLSVAGKVRDPEQMFNWAREVNPTLRKPLVTSLVRVCPILTVLLIIAGFGLNLIPQALPATALVLQFGALAYKSKLRTRMFDIAEFYAGDLRVYYKMLRHFEEHNWNAKYIKDIDSGLKNKAGISAFKQISKLSSLIDSIANRRNMVYFIINVLTLRDFHHLIALERWKQQSGDSLEGWFDALGQIEALASLAVIRFDNPHWAIPELDQGSMPQLEAKNLGHPLLKKGANNDLVISEKTKVLLITGSNMSGKSTLLRTAGINLVLAYAGAPVCAHSFRATIMEISTCMRVSDNLGESISSFYAELLRIKDIVAKAEVGKKVFFLLDEIFKGTNSLDRHTGAKVLINKLSQTNSIGMVSTHDLELCELEKENSKIANFHFQEYYKNGQIHFDYMLRSGPSTTRNALYLMKLAGIDIDKEK